MVRGYLNRDHWCNTYSFFVHMGLLSASRDYMPKGRMESNSDRRISILPLGGLATLDDWLRPEHSERLFLPLKSVSDIVYLR